MKNKSEKEEIDYFCDCDIDSKTFKINFNSFLALVSFDVYNNVLKIIIFFRIFNELALFYVEGHNLVCVKLHFRLRNRPKLRFVTFIYIYFLVCVNSVALNERVDSFLFLFCDSVVQFSRFVDFVTLGHFLLLFSRHRHVTFSHGARGNYLYFIIFPI